MAWFRYYGQQPETQCRYNKIAGGWKCVNNSFVESASCRWYYVGIFRFWYSCSIQHRTYHCSWTWYGKNICICQWWKIFWFNFYHCKRRKFHNAYKWYSGPWPDSSELYKYFYHNDADTFWKTSWNLFLAGQFTLLLFFGNTNIWTDIRIFRLFKCLQCRRYALCCLWK